MGRIPPAPPSRPQSVFLNCRNCGAAPRSGGLSCPYCGTQRTPFFFGGSRGGGMTDLLATPTPGRMGGV